MTNISKIAVVSALILSLGVILFPPVDMVGESSQARTVQQFNRQYGSNASIIPVGDYGNASSNYETWDKSSRQFIYADDRWTQNVKYRLTVERNGMSNSQTVGAQIKWESDINVGRMIAEIFGVFLIGGIVIWYFEVNK